MTSLLRFPTHHLALLGPAHRAQWPQAMSGVVTGLLKGKGMSTGK